MTARDALLLILTFLVFVQPLRAEDDERIQDEQTLREAGVAWDGLALLNYFRQRTPTEAQRLDIQSVIEKFADRSFRVREKATKELRTYGLTAIGQLKRGRALPDPETSSRCAKCLDVVEPVPSGVLTAAIARTIGRVKPDGGLDAVLAFLPLADDDTASDGLRWALARLAVGDGKIEPALLKALSDPLAVKRGAAAEAIVRAGLKEHFPDVAKLLRDPDQDVRLRTALILVTVAKDKSAIDDLIALLELLPIHLGWQAEEVLHRIAGEDGPKVSLVGGDAAPARCRKAWAEWWSKSFAGVDLAKLNDGDRIRGSTVMLLTSPDNTGGRVVEYAPDEKTILWQITGLQMPLDAQILPELQRVLLAENQSHVVTERDFRGKIHWKYEISQPVACQRLPNGNTFIAASDQLVEVNRNGKVVFNLSRNGMSDIVAARKSRDGQYVYATFQGRVTRIDSNKKEIRSFSAPHRLVSYSSLQLLPNNRVIITGLRGVVEFDEASGKAVWEADVGTLTSSVQRLSNGNTLVCGIKSRQIWELGRDGKILSERAVTDGIPWRVQRR